MPVLRNKLSETLAGGPRQFGEIRDRIIIKASSFNALGNVVSDLDSADLGTTRLDSAPVVIAEPRGGIEQVLEKASDTLSNKVEDAQMRDAAREISELDGDNIDQVSETILQGTDRLIEEIQNITGVAKSGFVLTYADFGPENLRYRPSELSTILPSAASEDGKKSLDDLNENLGMNDVWQIERGDQSIVAVFDTGYAEGLIDSSRIAATYHGDSVDSVFAPEEGHGTMTAGAAVANKEENPPYNGTSPDSEVILVRITDDNGQIRSDIITSAYDWLDNLGMDKPIVANHSYGTPLCSGRPKQRFCQGPSQDLVREVNSSSDIVSIYAAGNEANRCGHRPSGLTNAITSTNSLAEVITVGALRTDGREAQAYSSHGRGDCAPVADPKPNVSSAIPIHTYYGTEDGWEIKDMSARLPGSSAGGTSHASPTVAGMIALVQSRSMKENGEPLQTEELKQLLHDTAELPHANHINQFGLLLSQSGYDARFGHGQAMPGKMLERVGEL